MRERSKSCFVSKEELLKHNENISETSANEISLESFNSVITQIVGQIPKDDVEPYEERLEKIKWKKIQHDQSSYKKIKDVVLSSIDKVRKYRILIEVLEDAKLVFKTETSKVDSKKIINKFHLDEVQKKKQPVRIPFLDYYEHEKSKGQVKYQEARSKYKNMDDSEKLIWLLKFLDVEAGEILNLEQYTKAKDVFSQHEMKIIDEYEKKPIKKSAYNLFLKNYFKQMKERKTELKAAEIMQQASQAWKQLPEYEKQKQSDQLKVQYDEELRHFVQTLPQGRKFEIQKERKRKKEKVNKEDKIEDKLDSIPQKVSKIVSKKKNTVVESDSGNSTEKNKIKTSFHQEIMFNDNNTMGLNESSPKKMKKNREMEEEMNHNDVIKKHSSFNLKKPPESLYKFYALNIYKGPKNSAKTSYRGLKKIEKKKLLEKYQKAQTKFLNKLKEYLNTLSIEEMQNIQANNFEGEDISDITESSDESDE